MKKKRSFPLNASKLNTHKERVLAHIKTAVTDPKQFVQKVKVKYFPTINRVGKKAARVRQSHYYILRSIYRLLSKEQQNHLTSTPIYQQFKVLLNISGSGPRHFLRPGLNPEHFIKALNRRGVRYVLLRWWENFPAIEPGEDMDILLDDSDYHRLYDLLVDYPTQYPCDLYTVSGNGRGHYYGLPYFPTKLSQDLISERILYKDCVYVPSPSLYFASLSYHAIFHKGINSGIEGFETVCLNPEHNYVSILKKLFFELEQNSVDINVPFIVHYLQKKQYFPSIDSLTKLIDARPELILFHTALKCDVRGGELCVFIIRERTEAQEMTPKIYRLLQNDMRFRCMELVHSFLLNPEQQHKAQFLLRGGKWGKGPYPLSGGAPVRVLVVYDPFPIPLNSQQQQQQYRWFTNQHVLEFKQAARSLINAHHFFTRAYNGIHSSDNEFEAFDYLQTVFPEHIREIQTELEEKRNRYANIFPVKNILSKGRRSKVEEIEFEGSKAIKKTFRIGAEAFFEREYLAYTQIGPQVDFIPPLLWSDQASLIIPYVNNMLPHPSKSEFKTLLYPHRLKIIEIIDTMYQNNLAYINFTPGNILLTAEGNLFAVDFEFLQPYVDPHLSIHQAYEVQGIPSHFNGDLPYGFGPSNSCFDIVWKPYIGSWKDLFSEYIQKKEHYNHCPH